MDPETKISTQNTWRKFELEDDEMGNERMTLYNNQVTKDDKSLHMMEQIDNAVERKDVRGKQRLGINGVIKRAIKDEDKIQMVVNEGKIIRK